MGLERHEPELKILRELSFKKNIQSILISLWEYITSNHIFFEKFCKVCLI